MTLTDGNTLNTADIWFRHVDEPLVFPEHFTSGPTLTMASDGSVASVDGLGLHDVLAISVGDDVAALPEFASIGQNDGDIYIAAPTPMPQEDIHNTLPLFG